MSLFKELKRRNVFRVALIYGVLAWLIVQISATMESALNLPVWFDTLVVSLLLLGFPIALLLSWAFELTPQGIRREKALTEEPQETLATIDTPASLSLSQTQASAVLTEDKETVIEEQSIAVLPFVNMSSDQEQEYFSDGLTESFLHLLAQVKGLHVAARTSSFRFKNHNQDIVEIGHQLRVAHVLEGSVQRAGDQLRITAQLIKVADGFHLWSGAYDCQMDDIFAIQDTISRQVVDALKAQLLGQDLSGEFVGGTANTAAYEDYMLGLMKLNDGSYVTLPEAEKHFLRALEYDPNYVLAMNALGETYTQMGNTGLIPLQEAGNRIRPIAQSILQKDPNSGAGRLFRGLATWVRELSHPELAALDFQAAIVLAPQNEFVTHWVSTYYNYIGQTGKAIEILEQALQCNPLCSELHNKLSRTYTNIYDNEKAIFHSLRSSELNPGNPNASQGLEIVYNRTTQFDKAIALLKATTKIDPDDPELSALIALDYLALDMQDAASVYIQEAKRMQAEGFLTITTQMCLFYRKGQLENAVSLATQAINNGLQQRGNFSSLFIRIIGHQAMREQAPQLFLDLIPQWMGLDLSDPKIVSQIQYETKVYAVPILRMADRDQDAEAILEAAVEFRELSDSIDIGGFEIAVAQQHIENTLSGMQWLLNKGVFRDWWLYFTNAQLDFVSQDDRFQHIMEGVEEQLQPLRASLQASQGNNK